MSKENYRLITLSPDDPYYEMAHANGRVYEHRYRMAQAIGRPLRPDEQVHHKQGKRNNDPEDLELVQDAHQYIHFLEQLVEELATEYDNYEFWPTRSTQKRRADSRAYQ